MGAGGGRHGRSRGGDRERVVFTTEGWEKRVIAESEGRGKEAEV